MFVPSCNSNTTFDGSHSLLISIKTTTHCNHGKYPKKRRQQQSVSHRRVAEKNVSPRFESLVVESPALCSPPTTVSSRLSMEFSWTSSPSTMSAASKSLSVLSTTSKIKKSLVLEDVDHRAKKQKKQSKIGSVRY